MPERPLHSDVIFKKRKAFTDLHFTIYYYLYSIIFFVSHTKTDSTKQLF